MPDEKIQAIEAIAEAQRDLGVFLEQHSITSKEVEVNADDLIPAYALDNTPLSDTEQKELLASIKFFGLLSRVVVNDKLEIIDGKNRVDFAKQLGWKKIKVIMLENLTPGLEIFAAYQLNYARRHATIETKHKAYNSFKAKLLGLVDGKSREEAIEILPEIEKFWPEVQEKKRGPKVSEVVRTTEIISGVPAGTIRKWTAIDRAKDEMTTVLPEQYPTTAGITDSAALRFLSKKKTVKPGFSLVDSALSLCIECDKKTSCQFLRAIANRSCYSEVNQTTCKNCKPLDRESTSEKIFLQPSFALAEYYRSLKRIPVKDKAWRKVMLGRNIKICRDILEVCDFNLDAAKFCVNRLGNIYDNKGFSWTLETILKNIDESLLEWKKQSV
jgi:hypothetical protein